MGKTLAQIAQELKDSPKKVQLIYAFNGTGKTRLSRKFKELIETKESESIEELEEYSELSKKKILYYSAFTEDLFYWDNDLKYDEKRKLKIHPNSFTNWVFSEQGQEQNIITHFQRYTSEKLNPKFNQEYTIKDDNGKDITISAFSEITFSLEKGDDTTLDNLKISKGEESTLIWCIFYSLIDEAINTLNNLEERDTDIFDNLEYIFIDDPVTSLDENHLIELAIDLAQLIKSSESDLKFIITTHNPLFYNILHNELNSNRYFLKNMEDNTYVLDKQDNDSPFSYHLYLINELKNAVSSENMKKYHFNILRNLLEKTATFLGYKKWGDLFNIIEGDKDAYIRRIINLYSHSKHSAEEISELTENDKRVLKFLVNEITNKYHFNANEE